MIKQRDKQNRETYLYLSSENRIFSRFSRQSSICPFGFGLQHGRIAMAYYNTRVVG